MPVNIKKDDHRYAYGVAVIVLLSILLKLLQ